MSIGSSQGCASTIPQVMLENRLQAESTAPLDNQASTLASSTANKLNVEPASVDGIAQSNNTSVQAPPSINAVQATEPITNSIIQETIGSNKNTTANYQTNGQQTQNFNSGLLIDLKV